MPARKPAAPAAPKRTAAATAAVIRKGQETLASKLRAVGWVCIPPEDVTEAERKREARREARRGRS